MAGGWSRRQQVLRRDLEGVSQRVQVAEAHVALAPLDGSDVGPVELRRICQLLLAEPESKAAPPHLGAKGQETCLQALFTRLAHLGRPPSDRL